MKGSRGGTGCAPCHTAFVVESTPHFTGQDLDFTPQTPMGIVLTLAFAVHGVCFVLVLYRLIKGPTLADRVIASDLLAFVSIGFAIVYAVASERSAYLEVALVVGLIAFLGTVAFARYIERAYVAEVEE